MVEPGSARGVPGTRACCPRQSAFSLLTDNVLSPFVQRGQPDFLLADLAVTHGFRSSLEGCARQHDVVESPSVFALAHVEGSATVAAFTRDDLLEKQRPVMQAWADYMSG